MRAVIRKTEQRRMEGKETLSCVRGQEIRPEMIHRFMKRKELDTENTLVEAPCRRSNYE